MAALIVVDTGPLVALLDATEREHARVAEVVRGLPGPFVSAEPVLSEACFLLREVKDGPRNVLRLVRDGLVRVGLAVESEAEALEALMTKYADVPMSLADACLVRLTELGGPSRVLTFDSDFRVYRRHRSQRIELVAPWN